MKSRTKRIALALAIVASLVAVGLLLSSHDTHPDFGPITTATILESRTGLEDFVGEIRGKLFGGTANHDVQPYVSLGGVPLEIGGGISSNAFVYLNHPKLNNQPQWELALSRRTSLIEVTSEDAQCTFYGMNDPAGSAALGSAWRGHAVLVSEGRVVFIRALTNHTATYAIHLLRVVRGRGMRPRVEVRYLKMAQPGA